ncbi:MAG: hypothetical protein KKE43_08835, partial [Actinobacteria bacterium]|nr:hypothetical protein [Actinomycetota bacterium]
MAGDNDGIRGRDVDPRDTGGKPATPFVPGHGAGRGQAPKPTGAGETGTQQPSPPAGAGKQPAAEYEVYIPERRVKNWMILLALGVVCLVV